MAEDRQHQALYRRYRPQTPAEVLGQDHVVRALTGAIRDGRLHHAFLFCGPRGTGKTSTARILAKMVNCATGPTAEPCGGCDQCIAIREGTHLDVVEIDAASHGGVEDARELLAYWERRARRLARALQALGVGRGDRVATLAWNSWRHLEAYYAVSGMGAVVHTVNPRLAPDDIAHILGDAGSTVLLADAGFAALVAEVAPAVAGTLRVVAVLADEADMPEVALAPGQRLLCYEALLAGADEDFAWPPLDENSASALCYTSGTTGRPKGVLFSHRSTVLHAYAVNLPDVFGLRAIDRVMPVVPMFHVNAWGTPYAAPMVGAALVMPGRQLDGPSLHALSNAERVTVSAGVPTVWLGLLQHLRATGGRLDTLRRLICGGSACPAMLIEAFGREYGVRVDHAWGMTECSPLGTCAAPKPAFAALSEDERRRINEKQGRAVPGIDDLSLSTNGTRLAELAPALRAAGLDRVNVSVDSLRPERVASIARRGRPFAALAFLRRLYQSSGELHVRVASFAVQAG